jgi:hypothetical protein
MHCSRRKAGTSPAVSLRELEARKAARADGDAAASDRLEAAADRDAAAEARDAVRRSGE